MAASLVAAEPTKHSTRTDFDVIQGTWNLVALEADGKQAPAKLVTAVKLIFKDDTLTFAPGEPGFTSYRYKLDPTTKPAGFSMTHSDGANKGKTETGIYLLEGDRLKICFGRPGHLPTKFTAKAKSGQAMYSLERQK
jgi:uncharacterized protein (TIGR03067 family)